MSAPIFSHRFALITSGGNRITQTLVAAIGDGSPAWADIPGIWLRPPTEADLAECKAWSAEAASETGKLIDDFRTNQKQKERTI
jgi:hypothetical protein